MDNEKWKNEFEKLTEKIRGKPKPEKRTVDERLKFKTNIPDDKKKTVQRRTLGDVSTEEFILFFITTGFIAFCLGKKPSR